MKLISISLALFAFAGGLFLAPSAKGYCWFGVEPIDAYQLSCQNMIGLWCFPPTHTCVTERCQYCNAFGFAELEYCEDLVAGCLFITSRCPRVLICFEDPEYCFCG